MTEVKIMELELERKVVVITSSHSCGDTRFRI
ncbi:uncharacterized protein METZ01_LOCUS214055 [marine metagenome]|uniref:Uncharacterized protein n=1 Tax=marine metagenome TaxID=408172 RepID=A0A382FGT5_9ZZZZ